MVKVKLPEASAVTVAMVALLPLVRVTVAPARPCEVEQSGKGPPQAVTVPLIA